jgi:hypothetical protein
MIMNTVAQSDTPYGQLTFKQYQSWVILTARRAGSEDSVTVEMTFDQWFDLPPVQYVVKTELSRQQPRRPASTSTDTAAVLPVPRGHIEWRQGQNWVILTAYLAGSQDAVTVEIPLGQWFSLIPVRAVVEERLERWQENKLRQLGEL